MEWVGFLCHNGLPHWDSLFLLKTVGFFFVFGWFKISRLISKSNKEAWCTRPVQGDIII